LSLTQTSGGVIYVLPFNINGDLRKIPSLLFRAKEKYLKTKQNKIQKMTKLKKSKALLHKDN
jgi:hypothetical protein